MPEQMSIDERVARTLVADDIAMSKLMAASYSPPPNTKPISEARELELWDQTDPTFDEVSAWREHILAGTDPWVAKTDIALRKFPNRKPLIEHTRPHVQEQIDYAEAMAKKSATARVKREEEAARVRTYPATPAPFPSTPGPVPLPLPRAEAQPAVPAVPLASPMLPSQPMTGPGLPMTGPGLPPTAPETGV